MNPISKNYTIGLLSAMPEELGHTIDKLKNVIKKSYGNLEIFLGDLPISKSKNINVKIITAWSGWGNLGFSMVRNTVDYGRNRRLECLSMAVDWHLPTLKCYSRRITEELAFL